MTSYFEQFRGSIEPEPKRKKQAQSADDPVRQHLETHESFAAHHITTFLYGSYKRSTAVGDIKDVDIVVVTDYTTDDDPVDVLNTLKDSLADLYGPPDLADQRRSIRVERPLPDDPDCKLTLDIIPAIYQGEPDEPLWVPDREQQIWVESHPRGHMAYASELNAISCQQRAFIRLTKMMKWWWQYQFECRHVGTEGHKRKPKGFWIEVMTGEYSDLSKESYPELIVALLENAFREFKKFRSDGRLPSLQDPGLKNQTIKTSMTNTEFAFFLDVMEESLGWAREAYNASSERKASEYWQRFFGDIFPLAPVEKGAASLLSPAATPSGLSFPDKPLMPRKPGGFA